jgi:hypothetical protein
MADPQSDRENLEIYIENLLDRILRERIEAAMFGPLPAAEMRAAVETVQTDLIKKLLSLSLSDAKGQEVQAYARSFVLLSDWLGTDAPGAVAVARRVGPEDVKRLQKLITDARNVS